MATIDDEFEYEPELVLDDDLPIGYQVYDSPEEYAMHEEDEDREFLDDFEDDYDWAPDVAAAEALADAIRAADGEW